MKIGVGFGGFIVLLLIIYTFTISVPILLIINADVKGSPKTNSKKQDGYNKIFPTVFTDDESSDEEKILEDLYYLELLTKDDNKKPKR